MARRRDPQTGKLLPDGIYPIVSDRTGQVTYRARCNYLVGGKRRHVSKTEKSVEAAIEWKLETDLKLNRGAIEEPHKITVATYFEAWREEKSANWSGSRKRAINSSWKKYILPQIGHLPLRQVTRRHIQRLISSIVDDGGCSSRTAAIYIVGVHSLFRDAIINEVIQRNPCHDLVYPKQAREKRPTWSVLELRRYIRHVQTGTSAYRGPLLFLAGTGCRIGEALALHWEDVDLDSGTAWIHRTLSSDELGRLHVVNRTKTTDEGRVIPMPEWLQEELKAIAEPRGMIWKNEGRSILPNFVREEHYAIIEQLAITRIRVHDIRHTVGSMLHASGVDHQTIQEYLGHSDGETTRSYIHPHLSKLRSGIDAVSRSLGYEERDTTTSTKKDAI